MEGFNRYTIKMIVVKHEEIRGLYFLFSKGSAFVVYICWVFGGVAATGSPSL